MLRHCPPEVSSLRSADRNLTATQGTRLTGIFSTEPATMRGMIFSNVAPASRRLISARPLQSCSACHPSDHEPGPTLRSQLLGWRTACPLCGGLLRHPGRHDRPSPFGRYMGLRSLENGSSRMGPSAASEPGLRRPKSSAFC